MIPGRAKWAPHGFERFSRFKSARDEAPQGAGHLCDLGSLEIRLLCCDIELAFEPGHAVNLDGLKSFT